MLLSTAARRGIAICVIAVSVVLVVVILAIPSCWPWVQYRVFGNNACADSAVRQLPTELVNSVNEAKISSDIGHTDAVILTHSGRDGESTATAKFLPEFCGFVGYVDGPPVSTDMGPGPATTIIVHDGKAFERTPAVDSFCISNTVPEATQHQEGIVMVFFCDRLYPVNIRADDEPFLGYEVLTP